MSTTNTRTHLLEHAYAWKAPSGDTCGPFWYRQRFCCAWGRCLHGGWSCGPTHETRATLLLRARAVAASVDPSRIQALSGTLADLSSADYRRLKEQLTAVRAASPRWSLCVFEWDTERTVRSLCSWTASLRVPGDYSPPGQVYGEATAAFRRVLDTGSEELEGPMDDRWGTWYSALAPVADPTTGAVIALLGMDVDARIWQWGIASKQVPLVVVLLILFWVGDRHFVGGSPWASTGAARGACAEDVARDTPRSLCVGNRATVDADRRGSSLDRDRPRRDTKPRIWPSWKRTPSIRSICCLWNRST